MSDSDYFGRWVYAFGHWGKELDTATVFIRLTYSVVSNPLYIWDPPPLPIETG